MENYEEKYKEALEKAKKLYEQGTITESLGFVFPELKESEDERIRRGIIRNLQYLMDRSEGFVKEDLQERIAWLEKQGEQSTEPKWCHHKVYLSNCSEEYRKAYYDGWNNCNMQYSQCDNESNDKDERIRKELIELIGCMHDADPRKKDWLTWLEKQGEQKTDPCTDCTNDKGCVTCEHGELRETHTRTLNPDKVIEWMKTHGNLWPRVTIKINEVIDKFKQDFDL